MEKSFAAPIGRASSVRDVLARQPAPPAAAGGLAPTTSNETATAGARALDSSAVETAGGNEQLDRIYAGLRGLSLLAGLGFASSSLAPGPERTFVLASLAVFTAYSAAAYAVAFRMLGQERGRTPFYATLAVLDLALVAALMHGTGGATSPMYRALYVWVAMIAFFFGYRGGALASLAALSVFVGFHARDRVLGDVWVFLVQAGGVLMHGPLIGKLVDRQRARAEALRVANEGLREAGVRLAEEPRLLVEEQAKLIQAEKLSSIGLLAAGVAHEINNPLSGVMGCVKALREGAVPPARREEYLETIREGLERMRATVQGLLDYARQRPPLPAEVDVADVAAACVRLIAPAVRKKDARVEVTVAPGAARVHADRSKLMQAIVNVLLNAVYAAPAGSAVVVSAVAGEGRTGIRIADRGAGIPRAVLGRVGDPFFTTKPVGEGTGLGLAITSGIVRAHRGELAIESDEGKGTTVTIWLPRTAADRSPRNNTLEVTDA